MLNEGVSFGLWKGIPLLVVGVAWFVEGYLLVREKSSLGKLGLILILVGGGWNFEQRLGHGVVIDNMSLFGLLYNNVADYLIGIGIILYGYSYFVRRRADRSSR